MESLPLQVVEKVRVARGIHSHLEPALHQPEHLAPEVPPLLDVGALDRLDLRGKHLAELDRAETGDLAGAQGRISTGLARPDYFNWPFAMRRIVAEHAQHAAKRIVDARQVDVPELCTHAPLTCTLSVSGTP